MVRGNVNKHVGMYLKWMEILLQFELSAFQMLFQNFHMFKFVSGEVGAAEYF